MRLEVRKKESGSRNQEPRLNKLEVEDNITSLQHHFVTSSLRHLTTTFPIFAYAQKKDPCSAIKLGIGSRHALHPDHQGIIGSKF